MMTRTPLWTTAFLALAVAAAAQEKPPAQEKASAPQAPPAAPAAAPAEDLTNFIDFGFRGTIYTDGSDTARHQRYRDLRNGLAADALRYSKDTSSRRYSVEIDHAGYRDQRYAASFEEYGSLKASFEWNQVPLFFSEDTRALYTSPAPGVLRIDDPIQSGIQTLATTLPAVVDQAVPFDMRIRRHIADFRLNYLASPNVDLNVLVRQTRKTGSQPWAGTFGFGNSVELATPVDTRTTELGTTLEWSNDRGMLRAGYDGSFFNNHIETLVWDNPLRITDSSTSGPYQGRMALWPDSTMNTGTVMGMLKLPARSRATAYVSVGRWSQDEALLPFTINTALPAFSLDRGTADLTAHVVAMHYTFTSRPADTVTFIARYRTYDFENTSDPFLVTNTVSYDTSVSTYSPGRNHLFDIDRKTFDAELSSTPMPHTALRAGYTRENIGQTFRHTDTTKENKVRFSADLTGTSWLTLRGMYEHSKRTGSGFDEQVLDDLGEQTSLRQFDISDRIYDRVTALAMITATASISFNGHVTIGDDDREPTGFGVLEGRTRSYSVGADYVPSETVSAGIAYVWEKFGTIQRSRQANPGEQFDDPTRDWTTRVRERADTLSGSLDLIKYWPRTDVRFAYDYSKADSQYLYELTPDTTLPPVVQLPSVRNRLQTATVDARYYLTRRTAVGVMYWFDKYEVRDFATEPETLNSLAQPSFLILGYTTRPYTANTLVGRVTYFW